MKDKRFPIVAGNVCAYLSMLALCVTQLIVVTENLVEFNSYTFNNGTVVGQVVYGKCFLQTSYDDGNMCYYAYSLSSFTALGILLLGCLICCATPMSLSVVNAVFAVLTFIWWVVGASILTDQTIEANDMDIPNEYWRHVVVGLSWGQVVLSIAVAGTSIYLLPGAIRRYEKRMEIEAGIVPPTMAPTVLPPAQEEIVSSPTPVTPPRLVRHSQIIRE
jgi:hypothetical protein